MPNGRLAARIPGWESRPQQVVMADLVEEAIDQKKHAIIEAGTGTGKSLAYLIPAVLAATADQTDSRRVSSQKINRRKVNRKVRTFQKKNGKSQRRVVIATHTIALQEQLIRKDIPVVSAVMPREFSAVLVKGRGNYVSLRRLALAKERQGSLFQYDEEVAELEGLLEWSEDTRDGSLSDLPTIPRGSVMG